MHKKKTICDTPQGNCLLRNRAAEPGPGFARRISQHREGIAHRAFVVGGIAMYSKFPPDHYGLH